MVYYAGIGSRETPLHLLEWFSQIGAYLAGKGFVLRSGHAPGADQAFETGCDRVKGLKEIYLPWRGFEGSRSSFIVSDPKAFELASTFHPNWDNLKQGAQKLQARNSHQVFGWDLQSPSAFILCWTKNGKGSGGTGQAIRMAKAHDVPIFDAGKYPDLETCKVEIKLFLEPWL